MNSFFLNCTLNYTLEVKTILCPKIFVQHVWAILKKNTQSLERKKIENNEHYHFSLIKVISENRFITERIKH